VVRQLVSGLRAQGRRKTGRGSNAGGGAGDAAAMGDLMASMSKVSLATS